MKKYQGFKYKIRIRLDGRYLFAVWWADANSRRDDPIWLKTVASKAAAERGVKRWIDDRQPTTAPKGSAMIAALSLLHPGCASIASCA